MMAFTRQCLLTILVVAGACFPLSQAHTQTNSKVVRLAIVNTPKFSGLIDALLEDFKSSSGLQVTVYAGSDVYERARAGEADIVISHYGKAEVERFVLDGYGSWPRTVFFNQLVLAGPKSDPAGIRSLASASEAFSRIAKAKAPFVANNLPGIAYLTNLLWEAAGGPDKSGWFLETEAAKGKAVELAESKQAYVIWGALPLLRYKSQHDSEMEIMVAADPVLQRVMAAILVSPDKVPGVNSAGAEALQKFLLEPRTQAKIAAFRSPGSDLQLWWPAGRNNASEGLDE